MPKSSNQHYFITRTAEFVSPCHPDKICDIVSDTILDAYLRKDPNARVAIETMGGHGRLYLVGEITSNITVDYGKIVRPLVGKDIKIETNIVQQSPEIARGVDLGGAGDQGIMVGYACAENAEYLPTEYVLTRNLCKYIFESCPYDGKTQITIKLEYGPKGNFIGGEIQHVVVSWQKTSTKQLCILLSAWLSNLPQRIHSSKELKVSINPAGDWDLGGFDADSGLTGRKLIVDNYGPRVPIAHEVLVNISYALGESSPIDATVFIDGKSETIRGYDLSPRGIIRALNLLHERYADRAKWGHFSA